MSLSSDEILNLKFIQVYHNNQEESQIKTQFEEEILSINDLIGLEPDVVNNQVFELRLNKLQEDSKGGSKCTYAHIIINKIKKSKDS